jgi:transposase-like protein
MKRPRRNHSAAYKAKVALVALKGDATLSELAEKFGVRPNRITRWKSCLLEHAVDVFSTTSEKQSAVPDLKSLHAQIGPLTRENDFLAGALGRLDDASAKR